MFLLSPEDRPLSFSAIPHAYIYIHTYIYTSKDIQVCIIIYVCTYIYMYVRICMYIGGQEGLSIFDKPHA